MLEDLELARQVLSAQAYTCVIAGNGAILYQSRQRGVRPLLTLLDSHICVQGSCASDRVVGKATAMLYCLLGVRAVYAGVMSEAARDVLTAHGITSVFEELVDGIRNRAGTGRCPMELATANISQPEAALVAIRSRLAQLAGSSPNTLK